ncbi:hypothetical protein [uncultured Formosa sp.]|uniref:hypothetical protein n=1 Tax=uncultured Formosa sp. TaxID=255435 RepID=UPI00261C493D|nr:hypothetical protein [uncultured Formosa sp.]
MKKILFLILIILMNCSSKKSESTNLDVELKKNWTEFNTKDSIPELLNLALKKILKNNFEIANPNEKFNQTDVLVYDSSPIRQLKFLSKKNNTWRIVYIQGGIGKHYVYAECKIINDSISDFKISQTTLNLVNNDSIDKYLAKKKLKPNSVKIIMK